MGKKVLRNSKKFQKNITRKKTENLKKISALDKFLIFSSKSSAEILRKYEDISEKFQGNFLKIQRNISTLAKIFSEISVNYLIIEFYEKL